jgi:Fe-S cluster assembly protein SufD
MAEIATASGFNRGTLQDLLERDAAASITGEARERAFQKFEALPVPSPETEEWRYTDLRRFDLDPFRPFKPEPWTTTPDEVPSEIHRAAGDIGERSGLAIQHNSSVISCHLDPGIDAHFESIDDALKDHPEVTEPYLHRAVPADRTRFTALHAAFRTGGAFVRVPKGLKVAAPLQSLTYVDQDGLAVFPHTLIVLEEGAELTFIDRYASPDLTQALSDAVVELYVGPNAKLRYVSLQEWGSGVTHLSVQRAVLDRDAELRSLSVAFGGTLSRTEAESILEGDGGYSEMLGVYFGDGDQHFDHRSIQDHIGSRTSSDLLYKGALKDSSRAIYSGTVIIRKGAHQCNAYQTNRNILLSEHSKADSIPNLEILSNDPVRCGHAASVGPVDEDVLFYLQTRGIAYPEAVRLVVTGFFQEVLDRVTLSEIRGGLEQTIQNELAALVVTQERG